MFVMRLCKYLTNKKYEKLLFNFDNTVCNQWKGSVFFFPFAFHLSLTFIKLVVYLGIVYYNCNCKITNPFSSILQYKASQLWPWAKEIVLVLTVLVHFYGHISWKWGKFHWICSCNCKKFNFDKRFWLSVWRCVLDVVCFAHWISSCGDCNICANGMCVRVGCHVEVKLLACSLLGEFKGWQEVCTSWPAGIKMRFNTAQEFRGVL